MYYFWWHKPLDIERPTVISGELVDKLLAFMYLVSGELPVPYRKGLTRSPEAAWLDFDGIPQQHVSENMIANEYFKKTAVLPMLRRQWRFFRHPFSYSNVHELETWPDPNATCALRHPERSQQTRLGVHDTDNLPAHGIPLTLCQGQELGNTGLRNRRGCLTLQNSDVQRWILGADLLRRYKDVDLKSAVVHSVRDLPLIDIDLEDLDLSFLLAFNASGILYGGLHALAWNSTFRRTWQRDYWRLSSILVMSFFPACTLVLFVERMLLHYQNTPTLSKPWVKALLRGGDVHLHFLTFAFLAAIVTYVCARGYLVVESFVNLTYLPAPYFALPRWSNILPHIG
jgi:hypothetical protein